MIFLKENIQATITIHYNSLQEKQIAVSALKPETKPLREGRVSIKIEENDGNILILKINAADITSFRAVINSYSRWLKILEDATKSIQEEIE